MCHLSVKLFQMSVLQLYTTQTFLNWKQHKPQYIQHLVRVLSVKVFHHLFWVILWSGFILKLYSTPKFVSSLLEWWLPLFLTFFFLSLSFFCLGAASWPSVTGVTFWLHQFNVIKRGGCSSPLGSFLFAYIKKNNNNQFYRHSLACHSKTHNSLYEYIPFKLFAGPKPSEPIWTVYLMQGGL